MRVLISDNPGSTSHALVCKDKILQYCPSLVYGEELAPDVSLFIHYGSLLESLEFAIANNFNLISRSTTGLSYDRNRTVEQLALSNNIGILHSHGNNHHTECPDPPSPDIIVAVGAGDEIGNTCSFGPGLDFYTIEPSQSAATAVVCGMVAQLLFNHPDWSFWQARCALRQTASNYVSTLGWSCDIIDESHDYGGYGRINFETANQLTSFDLFGPMSIKSQYARNVLQLRWAKSYDISGLNTFIWKCENAPPRETSPYDKDILFSSTEEKFDTVLKQDFQKYICFQSAFPQKQYYGQKAYNSNVYLDNRAGTYSPLEIYQRLFLQLDYNPNHDWQLRQAPVKTFPGHYLLYLPMFLDKNHEQVDLSAPKHKFNIPINPPPSTPHLIEEKYSNALALNGDEDHLCCDSAVLNTFFPRCYSFWFKTNQQSPFCFFSQGDQTLLSLFYYPNENTIRFHFYSDTFIDFETAIPINDNNWHFILLSIHTLFPLSENGIELYIDANGVQAKSFSTNQLDVDPYEFLLGSASSAYPFIGCIADFRIFCSALDNNNVRDVYNFGKWRQNV